jgi:uncharacterized protein (UPF0332 family)
VSEQDREIAANLERAQEALDVARQMQVQGHHDFAASRAYYAAFYAATAALLYRQLQFRRHSGVIAAVHRDLVREGLLDRTLGRQLNWLFELRGVGDYGAADHVPEEDARRAVTAAEDLVAALTAIAQAPSNGT